MRFKKTSSLIATALTIALVGCGSGDDKPPEKKGPAPLKTVALSGKVIDGYVSGATVWLDINGDSKFDAKTEPSTISTTSGDYAFEFTEEQAACVPYSTMYVDVPVGAIDEDLGEVTEAYQMAFPPSIEPITDEDIRNISPLTSVIWGQLRRQLQGSGKGKSKLSCDELKADSQLRQDLKNEIEGVIYTLVSHYNLSAEQIYSDFIANNDSDAYDRAQSIVKGLKASYKYKKELEAEYTNADEVRVVVYQSQENDEYHGFTDAWYRDEVIFTPGEDFIKTTKLMDNSALNQVDVVLMDLHEIGTPWGEQHNGWLSVREDTYINQDGSYRCGNIERVSFDKDGVHYELRNTMPTIEFPSFSECTNTSLDNPYERGFTYRYSEDEVDYGAELFFRDMNADFQTLPEWTNVKDKAENLDPADLFTAFDAMPYKFEDPVTIDINFWRKSKLSDNIAIHKNSYGEWRKETHNDDGTIIYECSDDGINWVDCE